MDGTGMDERRRYNVGAWKIPHAERDIAHRVLTAEDLRGYFDVMGSDTPDEHERWPVGAKVTYSVMLTDAEAAEFRAASNVRYVELAQETAATAVPFPRSASRQFMGMVFAESAAWHGKDVTVAILDGGTTTAVRDYMGWTLVGRKEFGGFVAGVDEITTNHGCLVAPCGVPQGGRILDGIIANDAGSGTDAAFTAGVVWAVDAGAQVINYSYAGATGSATYVDGIEYARDAGIPIVVSAGNDGLNLIRFPAAYSTTYANVFSSGNFNEATGVRHPSSNYSVNLSGVAPGASVLGLTPAAAVVNWSGTSASAPHMASLIARACTGGRNSPLAAATALKATARNTGQPAADQGAGAWDLFAALTSAGASSVDVGPGRPVRVGELNWAVPGKPFLAGQKLRPAQLTALGVFAPGDKLRMSNFPNAD